MIAPRLIDEWWLVPDDIARHVFCGGPFLDDSWVVSVPGGIVHHVSCGSVQAWQCCI